MRGDAGSRPTLRIGLTGPIGCGKSTVAAWLGELGATVIDADRIAHDVTAPGTPALAAIARTFGAGLLRADGSLDRPALGRIVFADPASLAQLEAIVHPAVRPVILDAMAAAEAAGAPAVVVEAIKLVEGGLAELCDEVWLVTCSADEQLARVRARLHARAAAADGTAADGDAARADAATPEARNTLDADAEARIAAQAGLVERLAPFASRVLDTSGSTESARARAAVAYREALAARA